MLIAAANSLYWTGNILQLRTCRLDIVNSGRLDREAILPKASQGQNTDVYTKARFPQCCNTSYVFNREARSFNCLSRRQATLNCSQQERAILRKSVSFGLSITGHRAIGCQWVTCSMILRDIPRRRDLTGCLWRNGRRFHRSRFVYCELR